MKKMGAKFSGETIGTQKEFTLPVEMEFLSHKRLDSEFDKLYLNSREKLHAFTENPSEELLKNITHSINQNSKFLTNCFNEASLCRYNIMELVTDRLVFGGVDDKVSTTKTKQVGKFFRSSEA